MGNLQLKKPRPSVFVYGQNKLGSLPFVMVASPEFSEDRHNQQS